MPEAEIQYRWSVQGKRGTAFKFGGTNYGLGVKQAQLDAMDNYLQTAKMDEDTLADDAKQAADDEKAEKKAATIYGLGYAKPYEWWRRGDPAEKVSFVDPVIARQHTTFYSQQGRNDDPSIMGSDEDPEAKPAAPAKKLNGYVGNHLLPIEKVSFVDPVIGRQHTTFLNQGEDDKKVAAPEKVHILEPEVYQEIANKNKPNQRTTFYNKQGVTNFVQEDGDAIKAEHAAEAKAKEGDIKEAQEGRASAAAKAGDRSEKTSIIEPMAYERRSNYNAPFMRTTFYGQQASQQHLAQIPEYNEDAGLWMLVGVQEDGDKIKAEQVAADKSKEGDIKEA